MRIERDTRLDALRGVAIVLMLLDHVLAISQPTHFLRYTLTRFSLPIFMGVAGYLWAARGRPSFRQMRNVLAAAVAAYPLIRSVGLPPVDILWQYLGAAILAPVVLAHPVACLVLGMLSAVNFPIFAPLGLGYEPGYVLAWCSLGVLAFSVDTYGLRWLERARMLIAIGRRPLAWYVLHLVILSAVIQWTN